MKKIIAYIKQIFAVTKTVTPQEKKEIETIATTVVQALDEVKAKKLGVSPKALAPEVKPATEAPAAAPKKKKRYYKPKQPKA